ncbi:MAG: hypothetical protein ACKOU6_13445 [Planctomycetota bacterium]
MKTRSILLAPLVLILSIAVCSPWAWAQDEFAKRASWATPTPAQVRSLLDGWLASQKLDEPAKKQLAALWPADESPVEGAVLLERLVETVATVLPPARQLQKTVQSQLPKEGIPALPLLEDAALAPLIRNNLKLYTGRWLAQQALYDEALEQFGALQPADVVDPASLLFYQSVSHHRLLAKEKCLPVITKLMENEKEIPRRYLTLAKLMEADLAPLKPDSLDEIARLMDDIHRRLDLGRAGTKVRQEEDDVIAKLDKMIEDLEQQQQQQQQQQQSGSGGSSSPSSPKQESTPGGVQGPGNVDPKNIGSRSGWGDLPPKQRLEALQQISKDLPAHYRETIEEYFRKLARDGGKK